MKLSSTTGSSIDAQAVQDTLASLVTLAMSGMQQAPQDDPVARVARALVESITTTTSGNDAIVNVALPKNFGQILAGLAGKMQQSAVRTAETNRFKQVALSMLMYADTHKNFPFKHVVNDKISEKLSWRVLVLPYLEEEDLFKQFDISQPWDSPKNLPLAEKVPKVLGNNGKSDICWIKSEVQFFADITDGLSNTICLMEYPTRVEWTKPTDLSIDDALKMFDELNDNEKIIVAFYDGSVTTLSKKIDRKVLRGLLTPKGGEPMDESIK